jgi:hypothetical protein
MYAHAKFGSDYVVIGTYFGTGKESTTWSWWSRTPPVGTIRSGGCVASIVSKPRELLVDPDRVKARNHFSQFAFTVSSIHI